MTSRSLKVYGPLTPSKLKPAGLIGGFKMRETSGVELTEGRMDDEVKKELEVKGRDVDGLKRVFKGAVA